MDRPSKLVYPEPFQYIPATVFDNPSIILNDKAYVRKLKKLNPVLRSMWLEGKWDVFQGMYFDMWNILHISSIYVECTPYERVFSTGGIKHFELINSLINSWTARLINPFTDLLVLQALSERQIA